MFRANQIRNVSQEVSHHTSISASPLHTILFPPMPLQRFLLGPNTTVIFILSDAVHLLGILL